MSSHNASQLGYGLAPSIMELINASKGALEMLDQAITASHYERMGYWSHVLGARLESARRELEETMEDGKF